MAVNEEEWKAANDSLPMLRHLGKKASGRKLRLFAVACSRRLLHLLTDERNLLALDVAERYADGEAKRLDLRKAEQASRAAAHLAFQSRGDNYAALAATEAAAYTAYRAAYQASYFAQSASRQELNIPGGGWIPVSSPHADLIRDIFGNPFRPAPPLPPSVIGWNDGTVEKIALAIYEERAWNRLPVLADALEDAGCDDVQFLQHLRGPGPHTRGCWPVDAILGRS
jgi:hypothetical protein